MFCLYAATYEAHIFQVELQIWEWVTEELEIHMSKFALLAE